jgi:F-box domain
MDEEIDLISNLPDALLVHILSLLSTKEAVQTSFVSKRWRKLWTSLRCVNFDLCEFREKKELRSLKQKTKHEKYEEFVKMHMAQRHKHPHLQTFRITFMDRLPSDGCSELVRTWAIYVAESKPRVFSVLIHISNANLFEWVFISDSIEEMSLLYYWPSSLRIYWGSIPINYEVPKAVNLPQIRRLHLENTYLDKDSTSILLSGCPVLEYLTLKECEGEFAYVFRHKLKYLAIERCSMQCSSGKILFKQNVLRITFESDICENLARPNTIIEWRDNLFDLLSVSWSCTSYLGSTFLRYIDRGNKSDLLAILSSAEILDLVTWNGEVRTAFSVFFFSSGLNFISC